MAAYAGAVGPDPNIMQSITAFYLGNTLISNTYTQSHAATLL